MISQQLFRGTKSQAWETMKKICQTQGYCIVNFLYFAQAMKYKVYEDTTQDEMSKDLSTIRLYKSALSQSDVVFIDGIAMQIFDRFGQLLSGEKRSWTENLNGTDFLPYILTNTQNKKVGIIMSSLYDPTIGKGPEWMDRGLDKLKQTYPHIDIIFAHQSLFQKRGQDFPRDKLKETLEKSKKKYDYILFLNGLGSPAQETRTEENRDFFEQSGMIVMNNGATLDYYSGFETRAPKWLIKIRIGETLWRVCSQPKKNLHKLLAMFLIVKYWRYIIKKKLKIK